MRVCCVIRSRGEKAGNQKDGGIPDAWDTGERWGRAKLYRGSCVCPVAEADGAA